MTWKHYSIKHTNRCSAVYSGERCTYSISIGTVSTGKQRVFVGFFCAIECKGLKIVKEHLGALHSAFMLATADFIEQGYSIKLFGLHQDYYESGLSENSGYGYVSKLSKKAELMIDELIDYPHTSSPP